MPPHGNGKRHTEGRYKSHKLIAHIALKLKEWYRKNADSSLFIATMLSHKDSQKHHEVSQRIRMTHMNDQITFMASGERTATQSSKKLWLISEKPCKHDRFSLIFIKFVE